jgi:hypothetical protein
LGYGTGLIARHYIGKNSCGRTIENEAAIVGGAPTNRGINIAVIEALLNGLVDRHGSEHGVVPCSAPLETVEAVLDGVIDGRVRGEKNSFAQTLSTVAGAQLVLIGMTDAAVIEDQD